MYVSPIWACPITLIRLTAKMTTLRVVKVAQKPLTKKLVRSKSNFSFEVGPDFWTVLDWQFQLCYVKGQRYEQRNKFHIQQNLKPNRGLRRLKRRK